MKSNPIYIFTAVLLMLFALPTEALIVLGGDAGHTNAPADDPGWDNIGYVRSMWNESRAGGVYLGDGWVLTAYHVIYFDAPTGIVFNADGKAYPIDVNSYIRIDTTNFVRLADSPDWTDPYEVYSSKPSNPERADRWRSLCNGFSPEGADLAMLRLSEYPDIKPVHITEISKSWLPIYLSWPGNDEVTAIATGRPRLDELSYWTTNLTDWAETGEALTNAPYSGYYDWPNEPDPWYQPICRWGKNELYSSRITITVPTFGSTICLPTVFNDYDSGGDSNTFQMARLDSGGGVFYKGTGKWELLGLLTAKQLPDNTIYTTDRTIHPFGSSSMICDLSLYREQIMKVTAWPDLALRLPTDSWLEVGQSAEISIITTNSTTNAISQAFTNTLQLIQNGQTNEPVQFPVPGLAANTSITNIYPFLPEAAGTWTVIATTDSENQIYETYEQNNQKSKTFYAGPDLIISDSSPTTTNAAAGAPVSIEVTVENQGRDDITNAFPLGFYVVNSQTGDGTTNAAWTNELQGLSAGTSTTVVATFTAPTNTGSYYVVAQADDFDSLTEEGAVDEAREDNNDGYTPGWQSYSILNVGPDLTPSLAGTVLPPASGGKTIEIKTIDRNVGGDPATNITNILQLSTNSSFSTFTNVATNAIATLNGYSTQTNTFSFQTPNEPGTYSLRVVTDTSNSVEEFNNNNNNTSDVITLYIGPDLTLSFTKTNALRAMAGATVKAYADISNTGSGSGIPIENILQLSTNLAFTAPSGLATNIVTDSTVNELFRFKAPRKPGTYYLRAQTDPQNLIPEFNETNNFSEIIMLNVKSLAMPWLNLLLD